MAAKTGIKTFEKSEKLQRDLYWIFSSGVLVHVSIEEICVLSFLHTPFATDCILNLCAKLRVHRYVPSNFASFTQILASILRLGNTLKISKFFLAIDSLTRLASSRNKQIRIRRVISDTQTLARHIFWKSNIIVTRLLTGHRYYILR